MPVVPPQGSSLIFYSSFIVPVTRQEKKLFGIMIDIFFHLDHQVINAFLFYSALGLSLTLKKTDRVIPVCSAGRRHRKAAPSPAYPARPGTEEPAQARLHTRPVTLRGAGEASRPLAAPLREHPRPFNVGSGLARFTDSGLRRMRLCFYFVVCA